MADIHHELSIRAPRSRVFKAISTPNGLNAWWTLQCKGEPGIGQTYMFDFGPQHRWLAGVTACAPPNQIEWAFTDADPDWLGTRVRITLRESSGQTVLRFAHTGWLSVNSHYRVSSYCWAQYLRLLKRFVEQGSIVAYARRLNA